LHNNDSWESSDEGFTETELNLPEILEVKSISPSTKWITSPTNVQDVPLLSRQKEPPKEVEPFQNVFIPHKSEEIEGSLPQIYKDDLLEEISPFVHQVESIGPKYGEIAPFYVTLQLSKSMTPSSIIVSLTRTLQPTS